MIKNLLLFTSFSIACSVTAYAQTQTYHDHAVEVQKAIWDNPSPEFTLTEVPAQYSKESAVILARTYTLERNDKSRLQYLILGFNRVKNATTITTMHERVKIYDKAALEKFSTLEYQKMLDNTERMMLFSRNIDKNETFVGAKIIKPNGKQVIVNTEEEVLTKNTGKDKQGKLAIPDLQTGDILDYYISTYKARDLNTIETFKENDHVFTLVDEYPVLNYNLNFNFAKATSVKYLLANNAPALTTSIDANGDQIGTLSLKNIPKHQSTIWTSPYRQYPYLEIGFSGNSLVDKSKITNELAQGSRLSSGEKEFTNAYTYSLAAKSMYKDYKSKLKDYFGGSKALKAAPQDSILHAVYNIWKFNTFGSYEADNLQDVENLNYRTASSKMATIIISQLLSDLDIKHDVLVMASRNSNALNNVYNLEDFDTMIAVDGVQPVYLCFNDVMNHYNEIPQQYQGEKTEVMHLSKTKSNLLDHQAVWQLPVSAPEVNASEEQIKVSLQPDNMQKVKIERVVKLTGAMRHGVQKGLLSAGEVDKAYMDLAHGETLDKRLASSSETKRLNKAFAEAFDKGTANRKDAFTEEIKGQYDQEPSQLTDFKVSSAGLDNSQPAFTYKGTFVMDNMVKKAGGNYILDVGKLTGSFLKLDDKDRNRTIDVYMTSARAFKYNVNIIIPPGYQVKGIEELKRSKSNNTGMFSSAATVNGNVLTLTVNRVYNHNFEEAASWPMMTEIIDEAANFNNQKILLEKQGS